MGACMRRLQRRVGQIARGWEDRPWIVTDKLLEFETLLPVPNAIAALQSGVWRRVTREVLGGTREALPNSRGGHEGRALARRLEQRRQPQPAERLVQGLAMA
jgi:hypothetical protein